MLSEEAMLSACQPAREFSATFNDSLLGTEGVIHVVKESRERGKLSAREKFRRGVANNPKVFPPTMPVEDLYPHLIVSMENTQKIIDAVYPNCVTLELLLSTQDPELVRYAMEQSWCKGEKRGFYEIKKEIFLFVKSNLEIKRAGTTLKSPVTTQEYLDDCFETMFLFECKSLVELKDESRLEVQRLKSAHWRR